MVAPQKVVYRGESFRVQSSGRYYQSGRKSSPERLLHRRVWIDERGPIPDGMHVHHINHDWADNRIENLELVVPRAHFSEHIRDRMSGDAYASWLARVHTPEAKRAAAAWHGSAEGLEWHRKHGKRTWTKRKQHVVRCCICGLSFDTFWPRRARFCSKSCYQYNFYRKSQTSRASCLLCGKEFVFNKYHSQKCCSRLCANRLRGADQRLQSHAGLG